MGALDSEPGTSQRGQNAGLRVWDICVITVKSFPINPYFYVKIKKIKLNTSMLLAQWGPFPASFLSTPPSKFAKVR